MSSVLRVLCAGDRFITPDALGTAARASIEAALADTEVEVVEYGTAWPDEPFGDVDGVREASGDPGELAALAADVDVALTHLAPFSTGVLRGADRLRVVGVTRGGPVNVDLDAATAKGIPVAYLPGRNLEAAAEFTVGMMLASTRGIASASTELSAGRWDARWFRHENTGPELRAATVGLVGLGAVGRRVAELVRGFGARVVGHDPFADPDALRADGIESLPLAELLAVSDIVSVHARLTPDTRRMIDADAFAAMKPGAYFVNTARGELVDQQALLAALESGRLAGAALDVFDPEPPVTDDPLPARPDVVATAHIAGASRQVAIESARRVADEVAAFLASGELEHCANPGWRS